MNTLFQKITLMTAAMSLVLFTGCGGGGGSSNGSVSERNLSQMTADLAPGSFDMTVSGRIESAEIPDEVDMSQRTSRFQPHNGTNAYGPYRLMLREYVVSVERGRSEVIQFMLFFGEGVEPGSYQVQPHRDWDGSGVAISIVGEFANWRVNRHAEGQVRIASIGDELTLAFDIKVANNEEMEDSNSITARGAVNAFPLQFQPEKDFSYTLNGESGSHRGSAFTNIRSGRPEIMTTMEGDHYFTLTFHSTDIQSGEFIVTDAHPRDRQPGQVHVRTPGRQQSISGTVTLNEDDGVWSGTFDITTEGGNEFAAQGKFDHVQWRF